MRRITLAFLGLGLAACASAPTAKTDSTHVLSAATTRVGSEQVVEWSTIPAKTPVRVEMSRDPLSRPGAGKVLAQKTEDDHLSVPGDAHRTYYLVTAPSGESERTALRVLPLEGGRNFRDLGGYRTADGRSLKWGRVFRSGALSGLTDADYALVDELGIHTVVDFRSTGERLNEPTRWRAAPAEFLTKDYSNGGDNDALAKALRTPGATPETVAGVMMDFYRNVPDQFADQYAAMFHKLAKGDGALLFHCSAGKDRTGVAAGILLTVLGVPRETVLSDYAMSEKVVDYMAQMNAAPASANDPYAFLRRLPPDVVRPLMRSDPRYLQAALDEIDTRYGSVDAYVRTRLGLSDIEIEAVKRVLLEPKR